MNKIRPGAGWRLFGAMLLTGGEVVGSLWTLAESEQAAFEQAWQSFEMLGWAQRPATVYLRDEETGHVERVRVP